MFRMKTFDKCMSGVLLLRYHFPSFHRCSDKYLGGGSWGEILPEWRLPGTAFHPSCCPWILPVSPNLCSVNFTSPQAISSEAHHRIILQSLETSMECKEKWNKPFSATFTLIQTVFPSLGLKFMPSPCTGIRSRLSRFVDSQRLLSCVGLQHGGL